MAINTLEEKLDRSVPPVPGIPKDINFPAFFETDTTAGIKVLVIEDRKFPLVTARFVFKRGAYSDMMIGNGKSGLASVTAEMLSKGTGSRTATQIAEETDFIGATLSTGADFDASYVSCYSLSKHFDKIFGIAADVLRDPKFEDSELQRVKEQRVNSLLSLSDDGEYLASKAYMRSVYGNSPLASPVEGTIESVNSFSSADLKKYFECAYFPSNLIVAFVGDISPDEALSRLEREFGDWSKFNYDTEVPVIPENNKSQVVLTRKTGAVQSSLRIGHTSIRRNDPDFIKLSVMNTILGGYFTSRINKNLREVHGYTYSARSSLSSHKHGGDISVITEVKTEITVNTIREILKEINLMRESLPDKDELQNVKNYISGNFPLQLETPNSVASKVINLKLFGLKDGYYNSYLKCVNEISQEDIRDMARKYLHPDRLVFSIAGNVESISNDVSEFGTPVINETKGSQ